MFKTDAAVRHFHDRLPGIGQIGLLGQHLTDSSGAGGGHGHHDENHGQHHQIHQDGHAVSQQGHQVSRLQAALNDQPGSDPADQNDAAVHGEGHHRAVPGHHALRLTEDPVDALTGLLKFLVLVVLPHIGLHYPDRGHIFLYTLVQGVILGKSLAEVFHGTGDHYPQHTAQQQHRHQVDAGQSGADPEGHDHGTDQTHRRTHAHAQQHLIRVLDVGHIRGQPGHQPRRAEFVDIGKSKGLDPLVHGLAQVPGKACGSLGPEHAASDAEGKAHQSRQHHQAPDQINVPHVSRVHPIVDDGGHQPRNDHLHGHLADHKHRGEYGFLHHSPDMRSQRFQHF